MGNGRLHGLGNFLAAHVVVLVLGVAVHVGDAGLWVASRVHKHDARKVTSILSGGHKAQVRVGFKKKGCGVVCFGLRGCLRTGAYLASEGASSPSAFTITKLWLRSSTCLLAATLGFKLLQAPKQGGKRVGCVKALGLRGFDWRGGMTYHTMAGAQSIQDRERREGYSTNCKSNKKKPSECVSVLMCLMCVRAYQKDWLLHGSSFLNGR